MNVDLEEIDPISNPELYFAKFLNSVYVPDSTRPRDERWIIPINFEKLNKILEGE